MRYATRVFRGSKTCSCTEEDTIFRGSLSKRQTGTWGRRSTFALNLAASITIRQGLSGTSLELRNTSPASMVRRNLGAKSVTKNMQCTPTGRLTLRLAALKSTDVNVALPSQGITTIPFNFLILELFYMLLRFPRGLSWTLFTYNLKIWRIVLLCDTHTHMYTELKGLVLLAVGTEIYEIWTGVIRVLVWSLLWFCLCVWN